MSEAALETAPAPSMEVLSLLLAEMGQRIPVVLLPDGTPPEVLAQLAEKAGRLLAPLIAEEGEPPHYLAVRPKGDCRTCWGSLAYRKRRVVNGMPSQVPDPCVCVHRRITSWLQEQQGPRSTAIADALREVVAVAEGKPARVDSGLAALRERIEAGERAMGEALAPIEARMVEQTNAVAKARASLAIASDLRDAATQRAVELREELARAEKSIAFHAAAVVEYGARVADAEAARDVIAGDRGRVERHHEARLQGPRAALARKLRRVG